MIQTSSSFTILLWLALNEGQWWEQGCYIEAEAWCWWVFALSWRLVSFYQGERVGAKSQSDDHGTSFKIHSGSGIKSYRSVRSWNELTSHWHHTPCTWWVLFWCDRLWRFWLLFCFLTTFFDHLEYKASSEIWPRIFALFASSGTEKLCRTLGVPLSCHQ